MEQSPTALMSYAHKDNRDGLLTIFRDRLSDEVCKYTGMEFHIFQDDQSIQLGEKWRKRIETSIDKATFLIPIISPCFFNSQACRDELQLFIRRERKLRRNDLILPVYYIDCPLLNDQIKQSGDRLAEIIASRQFSDWRDLRFDLSQSLDVPRQVREALAQIAMRIRDAIVRIEFALS